jgi:hypothetical protein
MTNLDSSTVGSDAPDPDWPMLSSGLGTGGSADYWSFDTEYRVRPLPAWPMAFICAGPERGITTSRVEVEVAAIREAANAAVTLWRDDPYCSEDC